MKQPTPTIYLKRGNCGNTSEAEPSLLSTPLHPGQSSPSGLDVVSVAEEGVASRRATLARTTSLQKSTSTLIMQPCDDKRARRLPDTLDNDLLIRCASYLDADGLAQLGRTSARFGIPPHGQQRSLVNEAAHQQFRQSATDEERKCLSKHSDESDIGLYRALETLRQPLCFVELVWRGFGPQEHPTTVTHSPGNGDWSTAMSGHVMRGGTHFVEFAITDFEKYMQCIILGVIRPVSLIEGIDMEDDWEGSVNPLTVLSRSRYKTVVPEKLRCQRTAKWRNSHVHCCAYFCYNGDCICTDWNNEQDYSDWQGREGLIAGSATIGLLLELDEGTLSVFKNGRRLGEMKDGLGGEYVWFVSVNSACTISMSKGRAPN